MNNDIKEMAKAAGGMIGVFVGLNLVAYAVRKVAGAVFD